MHQLAKVAKNICIHSRVQNNNFTQHIQTIKRMLRVKCDQLDFRLDAHHLSIEDQETLIKVRMIWAFLSQCSLSIFTNLASQSS